MKQLVCIVCPKGCHLTVDEENGFEVKGVGCARGEEYGRQELINPTRVMTSTVKIAGASHSRCPVKTNGPIPKERAVEAVRLLDTVRLKAPVRAGDVVVENIFGSGVDFVVTRSMSRLYNSSKTEKREVV